MARRAYFPVWCFWNKTPENFLGCKRDNPNQWLRNVVILFLSAETDAKVQPPQAFSVVRKAITSYYTSEEHMEIDGAAKQLRISKSSFVASAALREARKLSRKS